MNAKSTNGKTALYHAAEFGSSDCVDVLLKVGADVNITDPKFGETSQIKAVANAKWVHI